MIWQTDTTDVIDDGVAIVVTVKFKASYEDRKRILELIKDHKLVNKLTEE